MRSGSVALSVPTASARGAGEAHASVAGIDSDLPARLLASEG